MKQYRKPLAFILSLVMAFTLLPLHAFASGSEGGTQYGDLRYIKYDDHIEIVGCNDDVVNVVVPATIEDLPVTVISGSKVGDTISNGAFSGLAYLESVDLSNAPITTIDDKAFYHCYELSSVVLPSTLISIGDSAFKECIALETITLPASLETIKASAFSNCTSLANVTLNSPSNLTTIGSNAFFNCGQLSSFSFPDTLTSIGASAFGSTALTSLNLANTSITEIGERTFASAGVTSVTFPNTLVTIGKDAFLGCTDLATVNWPSGNSLKTVSGFSGCTSLTDTAFANMPSSVTTIGEEAFLGCGFETVAIPANVTAIGNMAFNACESISSLTFASGITSIGSQAFEGCFALAGKRIDIPASVTSIGYAAFGYITNTDEGITDPFTLIIRNRDAAVDDLIDLSDYVDIYSYAEKSNGDPSDIYTLYQQKTSENITFTDLDTDPIPDPDPDPDPVPDPVPVPLGHIKLTLNGSFDGSNTVLIFDSEGKLVESGSALDGYQTAGLTAGTYTVVAFNKNDSFASVATLSQLDSMGLTQGEDYACGTVTVSDDTEATLTLSVPVLDTDALSSILADDGNAVLVETLKVGLGNTESARVQYSLKNAPLSAVNMKIELPENSILSGAYDETNKLTASLVGNTLTLPVTAQTGIFYIYFTANKGGEQSVSASITQGGVTAPVGTAMFTVETIFIDVGNRWTTTREGTAVINAGPQTPLTITMPDGSKRNLITNKAGSLRVNYTIPDTAASGDRFTITASSDTASASATIVYMPSDTQIKEFYFVHAGAQTYLVKDGKNSTTKYYTYVAAGNESDKYWTFSATITSPTEIAEDSPVTVLIGMMDGSSMTFDLTRVSSSGSAGAYEYTYAGEIYIDQLGYHEFKSSLIPCEFDLLFEDQIQSADTDAQFANAWNDAMDRMDLIQSAFSDTDVFNPQVMGELLSGFYKVSDKDWFAELPDDTKTAVLEAETQLEGAAKEFCLALKIPYDSVDDYLIPSGEPDTAPSLNVDKVLENNGISMSAYDGFDADALAADGYTIYTVPSQRRGPQQHVAIKETDEGIYTISEEEGFKLEVDYAQNAADNAATAAFIDSLSTVGSAADTAADALEVAGKAGSLKILGEMAGTAADVATVLDLRNNVNDMGGIYSDIENLKGYITNRQMWYNRYLNLHVSDKCLASMRAEIRAANELLDYLQRHARTLERDICIGITMFAVGAVVGGPAIAVLSLTIDYTTNSASMSRASMLEIYMHNLSIATARVMRDCEGEEEEALRRWKLRAVLDPSGVVYEAIESNVLEGVTATMWYADNAAGTGAVQWDASEYDQVNPQVTAADGRFAWDVPAGFWQVRFTKAGYEDAATEWLEVPPPRMNLAIPMVTIEAPKVESANAYEDYIEVIFDQYMDKSAALTLPDGMTGEWQGTDAYSKVLRITKDGGFTKGDEVALTIDGAKNYAGTPLSPSPYSETLTVGARPAEIILNYDSVVAMKAGETPNVTVRIKDSDGNYMSGVTLSAAVGNTSLATIDATATTDDSGKAVFASSALLPGLTDITFTADGTTLSKTVDLRITVDDNKPLRPTATIGSTEFNAASPKENDITVDSGETLTISAELGVSIFYTTDDTCPCQNSASRNVYTGPITLDATTRYRIAAYKDGMMYSDRLNINVTVNTPVEPDPIDPGPVDPVVPDPVNPSPLENRITGITAGDSYTIGQVITFTAVGAGMDNSAPNTGDTRWLPVSWSVNPHGDFSGGFTQTFASAEMALGAHTLHVIFAEQMYDGATWKNTGNEDEKTVNFTLFAANTPTVDPTVIPEDSEEVANTVDESMPLFWTEVLVFALCGVYVTMTGNRRRKEII